MSSRITKNMKIRSMTGKQHKMLTKGQEQEVRDIEIGLKPSDWKT